MGQKIPGDPKFGGKKIYSLLQAFREEWEVVMDLFRFERDYCFSGCGFADNRAEALKDCFLRDVGESLRFESVEKFVYLLLEVKIFAPSPCNHQVEGRQLRAGAVYPFKNSTDFIFVAL